MNPPKKEYYDVKVEIITPVTLVYRVFAESAEDALNIIEKSYFKLSPKSISPPKLSLAKKVKILVYETGSTILSKFKNY